MPVTIVPTSLKYKKDGEFTSVDCIRGDDGQDGTDGVTFTPAVSDQGVISWSNDGGKANPESVNIKGPKGDTGDPAPEEDIVPAVEGWLEENFSNPDSPPLDSTLTQSLAAAPANLTGILKSTLRDYSGNQGIHNFLAPNRSETKADVKVSIEENRVRINGTASGNRYFKITGEQSEAKTSVQPEWMTDRLPILSGHEYGIIVTPISGSATFVGGTSVYLYGSEDVTAFVPYGNAENGLIKSPAVSAHFTATSDNMAVLCFYMRSGNAYTDLVLQIDFIDFTEANAFHDELKDAHDIEEIKTSLVNHAPALQNAVFGTYRDYPVFSFDGDAVIIKIPGNAGGRAIWNNGYISDANTDAQTYTVHHNEYLVYSTHDKELRVESDPVNLTEYDIICLFNSKGALYGQWATMYALQIANATRLPYPEYYNEENYIQDRVDAINSIALGLGRQSLQTMFVTDTHWSRNAKKSPALVQYLVEKTGIKNVIFGGDSIEKDTESRLGGYGMLCEFMKEFGKPIEEKANLYYITGNHEQNDPSSSAESLRIEQCVIGHLFNTPLAYKIHSLDGINSFYVDDDSVKIRFYCVECEYDSTITLDTRARIFESLLDVPSGYAVMVFSHTGINASDNTSLTGRFGQIMQCCAAMNDGLSITINDSAYNFAGRERTFIGAMVGHLHKDVYVIYDSRFPVIGVAADTIDPGLSMTRVAGTTTEQAFDVVQIDVEGKRIYCTRIGAGADRVFSFGAGAALIS